MSVHFNDMLLSQFTPCAVYTSFHRTAEAPPQLGPGPSNPGLILLADKVPHPKTDKKVQMVLPPVLRIARCFQ